MIKTSAQSPSSIVMIRPHHFTVNAETAIDNAFQVRKIPQKELRNSAYQEITEAAKILSNHGIKVHIFAVHFPQINNAKSKFLCSSKVKFDVKMTFCS